MTPDQMTPEQLKKFLVYYRKRIDQEPANVEARLRLATVFRQMEKTPRAIEQYEKAAQLLDEQGLALEAIAACKAILELDPTRVEAQYFLARLYAQTPDATDGDARAARPIEPVEEPSPEELTGLDQETDEFERVEDSETGGSPGATEPPSEGEESADEKNRTQVADYSEMSDEFEWRAPEQMADADGNGEGSDQEYKETVELTPEEQERLDDFSRKEMQDLLTTIDVDPEEIKEYGELGDYEFDEEYLDGESRESEPDFELGESDEVGGDESSPAGVSDDAAT